MGRAMIVSAGANSNEYLSARLNEPGAGCWRRILS